MSDDAAALVGLAVAESDGVGTLKLLRVLTGGADLPSSRGAIPISDDS